MGTVFTIDIRDRGAWSGAIEAVVGWLHFVDATFSTYRDDSDVSRIRHGDVDLAQTHPCISEVLAVCAKAEQVTNGYFTTHSRGQLDPTGLVKGWSIQRASTLLRELGSDNHAINGGGDMQLAGEATPGRPWRVGISDPHDRLRVLSVVTGRDRAVATSGIAERGRHIVNPFTGREATALASVTVVGPALTEADAYATAAFAMGHAALDWAESLDGYEALLIANDGTRSCTSGWSEPFAR